MKLLETFSIGEMDIDIIMNMNNITINHPIKVFL